MHLLAPGARGTDFLERHELHMSCAMDDDIVHLVQSGSAGRARTTRSSSSFCSSSAHARSLTSPSSRCAASARSCTPAAPRPPCLAVARKNMCMTTGRYKVHADPTSCS